jgi:hypothetical protein
MKLINFKKLTFRLNNFNNINNKKKMYLNRIVKEDWRTFDSRINDADNQYKPNYQAILISLFILFTFEKYNIKLFNKQTILFIYNK